eukprot:4882994-Pyramimonas_sp.AAC.1
MELDQWMRVASVRAAYVAADAADKALERVFEAKVQPLLLFYPFLWSPYGPPMDLLWTSLLVIVSVYYATPFVYV